MTQRNNLNFIFCMPEFNHHSKSSTLYLDLAANGNGQEKAAMTLEAINRLAESGREKLHIVEVGPGGGSATDSIVDAHTEGSLDGIDLSVSFVELDGVESDSLTAARERLGSFAASSFIKGDLKTLSTHFDGPVDIIAASAVLHEVYSYGGGYNAIDTSIEQISKTLAPGGFFSYRDVLATEHRSLHERTRHIYDREAWTRFIGLFLPYYLDNATHPYHRHEDRIIIEQGQKRLEPTEINMESDLSISAPIGLLREIQRHYITLRDYAWRTGALGVEPILEGERSSDWMDLKRGHKRVHFALKREDPLLNSLSEHEDGDVRMVDGDIFDATTEVLLGEFLREVCENKDSKSGRVWQEWLKREGSETYSYMSLSELLGSFAIESLAATNGEKILLPVRLSDIQTVPRSYYNRFLESQLSNPLKDGKQLVLFEALGLGDQGQEGEEKLSEALSTISEYCTKSVLSEVYSEVRKRY